MKHHRARAERVLGRPDIVRVIIDQITFNLTQDEFNLFMQHGLDVLQSVVNETKQEPKDGSV